MSNWWISINCDESNEHEHVSVSKNTNIRSCNVRYFVTSIKNQSYKCVVYSKGVLSDILVLCVRNRVGSHSMDSSVRHGVIVNVVNATTYMDVC